MDRRQGGRPVEALDEIYSDSQRPDPGQGPPHEDRRASHRVGAWAAVSPPEARCFSEGIDFHDEGFDPGDSLRRPVDLDRLRPVVQAEEKRRSFERSRRATGEARRPGWSQQE